ncbi:MAG: 3-phosphoshikimate 1-carboxyvinyltransferase [bacterium]
MGAKSGENVLRVGKTSRLYGMVQAPASKSYTHRAIMVAAMNGRSRIVNPLYCEDTLNTIALWKKLGARIIREAHGLAIQGCGGIPALSRGRVVNVGESGTLLRFVLPLLALTGGPVTVNGRGSLLKRTNRQVVEVLQKWGVDIGGKGVEHRLPIRIGANGILPGGPAKVDGSVTSQVVSALLIAAPFARENTTLSLSSPLVSRPYVDITIDVLKWAGVKVRREGDAAFAVRTGQVFKPRGSFTVHGDWSAGAFLIAAAVLTESDVVITDLVRDSQGDRRIVNILRSMGAKIAESKTAISIRGPASLHGVDIDGSDIPDLVPILTVLGCFAAGTTRIRNVAHLVHKESDRLAMPAAELGKLGAKIVVSADGLTIRQAALHGGVVSACNDHRIAMSLAVAGLGAGQDVTINGAGCIAKSYPGFVADMQKLRANIGFDRT